MVVKRILIPAAALLAAAGFLFTFPSDDLTFEMTEGEWVGLHFWLPAESVSAILPAPLQPGRFKVDPLSHEPPGTMVDAYIFIRHGGFRLPLAGKMVEENNVLDLMLLLAVQAPSSLSQDGVTDYFLLDYSTSNQLLTTLLRNAGINARSLDGSFEDRTLPSTQQDVQTKVSFAGYREWAIHARSVDGTHFDLGNRTWRIFLGDSTQILTISLRDDFYMRAASKISGFHENNPMDRLGEWRWADSDTLLLFTSGSSHVISSLPD